MASTYSTNLRLELMANGDQSGAWGTTTNTNLGTLVEGSIAGYVSVAVSTASQALTAANGATDQARMAFIKLTGAAGAATLYTPPASKAYTINNATNGVITVSNATTAGGTTATGGSTVTIPVGATRKIYSDATNFFFAENGISVANGGTGASTFTSGGLLAGNGASAVGIASAAQIVAAIGATAVANATNASNATTSAACTGTHYVGTTAIAGDRTSAAQALTGITSIDGSAASATNATNLAGSGTITDTTTINGIKVGYRDVPQLNQAPATAITVADAGKHFYANAAGTFTIPANSSQAFPIGAAISFVNMNAGACTIAITTDTLYLAGQGTTGSRTLAQYGVATALKLTATTWIISGSGLT